MALIICLIETWLDMVSLSNDLKLNGFSVPYIRDRPGDSHRGSCVYVKESIYSKYRPDLEVNVVECLWIEICTKHRKFLLGTFNRPPNFPPGSMLSIETSFGLAFNTAINDVIVVGDLNLDMQKLRSNRKIETLCQMYNLSNIISEPTHFTESSSPLFDLFLVTNKNDIFLSGVGEPFLDQNITHVDSIAQYTVYLTLTKQFPTNMKEKFGFMIREITNC